MFNCFSENKPKQLKVTPKSQNKSKKVARTDSMDCMNTPRTQTRTRTRNKKVNFAARAERAANLVLSVKKK